MPRWYDRVVIPPAVQRELQPHRTPERVGMWMAHPPAWFEVRQPLRLVGMSSADREEATRRALRTTWTLGILEQAAIEGLLDLPSASDESA